MNASAQPTISPLARRLAEENNVDWRALTGSSAGGAVNERDVLDYLEAVMLGHRPLDPTPEPLPEGLSAWPEEAPGRGAARTDSPDTPWVAEPQLPAGQPAAAPPPAPARTFEPEYRAAQAELESLKAKVAALEAETARGRAERLELNGWRESAQAQEAALAKARAFEPQVAELKEALAKAQAETRKAQEHGFELAARLNKLNDAQSKAEAENRRLREANAGLEQANAALQNRPWWRFWG